MKVFSTFSGIGGFEIGIQNAYIRLLQQSDTETERGSDNAKDKLLKWQQPNCIGFSEIDKFAIKVYEKQFGGRSENTSNQTRGEQPRKERQHERSDVHTESIGKPTYNNGQPPRNYGDITKINAEELPDFDCLVGGFPCQAFSIAGKRKGFEDTRGTLFFDLARILRAKQPRLFVFENVKGLLSHDSGNTFKTIIQTIDELGYDCQWQVLNSKNHGVPQNRERVYIVGHLRGTPRPEVFPIEGTNEKDIVQINQPTHSNYRVYASDGISPTLNTMQGGNKQPFIAAQRGRGEPPVQQLEARPDDITNTITSVQKDNMVLDDTYGTGLREYKDTAPTLRTGRHGLKVSDDVRIRRLTPIECERLQGFPDNWTAEGIDGPISDSQRYKMAGNAVTVNVVEAVFRRIFDGKDI